ncbi:MAG TPA: GntR family transcriptional regulator [Ilumatobacteraceae bacterium]|jgi:DNA-binding GntR family transcriptional regulator
MKSTKKRDADIQGGPGAPRSKADRAYTYIRQRVLDGQHLPGERLVIEQLAREMDVSVVPVREAIRRLEAEGYVTYTRNIGATVTSIDLDRYPETVETVAVLEGVAIGLAAAHITAKDIKDARALNDQMRSCIDAMDPQKFTALNHQFHRILYGRCPNRHLLNMVIKEWDLLATTRKSAFSFIPERAIGSVAEHEQLLVLIESGRSADEVEAFARNHRMKTARSLLKHIGNEMSGAVSIAETTP